MENNYNLVETANNLFDRHYFTSINEPIQLQNGKEKYRSHYTHSEELKEYYKTTVDEKEKNTISGYKGSVALTEFVIDIDIDDKKKKEELVISLIRVKNFLTALRDDFNVDLNQLRINFSGSKGFHVRFDQQMFGGFEPSISLPYLTRELAVLLSEGIIDIDKSVYDRTRLMRVVNSYNVKSGLYAIPLTHEEIFSLTIDEIVALAKKSRDFKYDTNAEIEPCQRLIELKEKVLNEYIDDKKKVPITELIESKGAGERHEALVSIVGKLIIAKFSNEEIIAFTKVWDQQNTPPMGKNRINKETRDLLKQYGDYVCDFWRVRRDRTELSLDDYIKYLSKEGFAKVMFGKNYDYVRLDKNIASLLSPSQIGDHVFTEIDRKVTNKHFNKQIREELLGSVNKFFGEKLLERVNTIEINIKEDTVDTAHLFYKNGIVKVSRDSTVEIQNYETLDSPIWDTQIKERDFEYTPVKYKQSEFERFIWNTQNRDEQRVLAACSAIGYMVHKYKNRNVPKAIILMDQKVSENPSGRTGKSLVGKAISLMRESVRIDGKNYKFDSQFSFQEVSPTTEIVEFNDVEAHFSFEKLFSVLTDDMQVKYKYEKPFQLPFEKSPKIMVSTNYTIKGTGSSFSDRMFEVEFSDHYTEKWKPVDEFGHLFFDGWDKEEWNRFDNFMIECLELYLSYGLVPYKRINVNEKKLLQETSHEFLSFMRDCFVEHLEYNKDDLYQKFKTELGYESDVFNKCPIKKNSFTKYLKTYALYNEAEYVERESSGRYFVRMIPVQK